MVSQKDTTIHETLYMSSYSLLDKKPLHEQYCLICS